MDTIKAALHRHLAKIKGMGHIGDTLEGSHAEELRENGDKAPDLKDHPANMHSPVPEGAGLEEAMEADGDPNHHPDGTHPARSGGGLSPEEHQKIMHALSNPGAIGRKSMTLNERAGDKARAQEAAIHAKGKK